MSSFGITAAYHFFGDIRGKLFYGNAFRRAVWKRPTASTRFTLSPSYSTVTCALAVRTKVGKGLILADFREFRCKFVRKFRGKRHIFFGFVRGEAEHHSLISGAYSIVRISASPRCSMAVVHAESYVRADWTPEFHEDLRGVLRKSRARDRCSRSRRILSRAIFSGSKTAFVVISPITNTKFAVAATSQGDMAVFILPEAFVEN